MWTTFFFLYCIFWASEASDEEFETLTAPEIIGKHGYPAECHTLTTDAGYILTIHRIPFGRKCLNTYNKIPVLLQHGLMCSSTNFLTTGPEKGLAFVLADNGYDVWMPNDRGNIYSRKHITLSCDDPRFWDFSWHDIGADDMPNIIDYILSITGQRKLFYVGDSQGTTSFWIFNIFNQDYTDKIIAMFALAPIAFMGNSLSPLIQALGKSELVETNLFEILGHNDFTPREDLINTLGAKLCSNNQALTPEICSNIVFVIFGFDEEQMNKSNLHIELAHYPAGSSTKEFIHYLQCCNSYRFRQYDYGPLKNLKVYGQVIPPDYDLRKVRTPVYLYTGPNDWFATPPDLEQLRYGLSNLVKQYTVPFSKFNHLDFLIAKDVVKLVYEELLKDMRSSWLSSGSDIQTC